MDSATASRECLRIILAIISSQNWLLNSVDIKADFLQGKKIYRDVFIIPSAEASTKNKLWNLEKSVYGLNDADRMWHFLAWERLEYLGCKRSSLDYGAFA